MKIRKLITVIISVFMCILMLAGVISCGGVQDKAPDPTPDPQETPTPTPPPSTPEPTPEPVELVPYDGVVEHLFFHEVIAYPEIAFSGSSRQRYDTEMVTVLEFQRILESLYNNDFILVDLNIVWSEYTNDNGQTRMRSNTLMLPEGKKPIVISFDDLSFYEYMKGDGFMERYIIGSDGNIWAEGIDPSGNAVVSQDLAAITILDKFVRENPGFSHNGAKGCIAFTGYEGILGYRTQKDLDDNSEESRLNRMQEVARVQPVVQRLKDTGWYFATHSYGHIRFPSAGLTAIQNDAVRWMEEVGSLVGETQILIFPFGEPLDGCNWLCQTACGPGFLFYHELGFRLFAAVGREPYTAIKTDIAAVRMDRMASIGTTLRQGRERFLRFYDAKDVFDPMRPEEYGTDW